MNLYSKHAGIIPSNVGAILSQLCTCLQPWFARSGTMTTSQSDVPVIIQCSYYQAASQHQALVLDAAYCYRCSMVCLLESWSICLYVRKHMVSPAKIAKPTEEPFTVWLWLCGLSWAQETMYQMGTQIPQKGQFQGTYLGTPTVNIYNKAMRPVAISTAAMHNAVLQFIGLTSLSISQLMMLAVVTIGKSTNNIFQLRLDKGLIVGMLRD